MPQERIGLLAHRIMELVMVGQCPDKLPDTITSLGNQCLLDVEQVALLDLLRHQAIEVGQMRSHEQAYQRHGQRNEQQHPAITQPLRAVEAADGLAQGVNAIGEREHGVYRAEEGVGHLDRVQTRAARDLDEHHDDA